MTMTAATSIGAPYTVPPEPSRLPSILLAAAVHAGLLGFLWAGISWQNTEPVAVTAEVWDMKTQDAAPPPPTPKVVEDVTPKPEPKVEPKPEPKVEPKPEPKPVPPPPKPVDKIVAPKPPDIALERQKQKELKQKQLADEKLEREKELKERELKEKELLKDKQDKKLADEKKAREADEKKAKELAEEKKAKELADAKAKKLAEAKKAAEEDKKMAKLREAEMQRITGAAGSSSGTAPTATAPRIDSGYLSSIRSKIKSTTSYLGSTDVPGNPRAVFKIEELPTGEIISVRMIKSSGLPAFDDAVEKGIIKSSPLPKKKDGTVERTLEIGFSMKDLD